MVSLDHGIGCFPEGESWPGWRPMTIMVIGKNAHRFIRFLLGRNGDGNGGGAQFSVDHA